MPRNKAFALLVAVACCPAVALSQDARSIMEMAQQKQLERWEGVNAYVVEKSTMGSSTRSWYQRAEVVNDDGEAQTVFLPVAEPITNADNCEAMQTMTPEALEAYAAGSVMVADGMANEIEDGLEEAGLPRGMLAASGSDPTATFDPRVMMGANAEFLRGAANAKREQAAADPQGDALANAGQMEEFISAAELIGKETIDGREAFHLRADGIDRVEKSDGREYRMDAISMWIDAGEYVPLRMKVDGTLVSGKETQPMTIETIQTDYRTVPDSKMYESYKQVMKIAGVLDARQQAEMQEAQAQMAEFEKQLASMPASQRKMMENMMGPQLEMMRNMAAGNGFQTEIVTNSITVNPPMVGPDGQACK